MTRINNYEELIAERKRVESNIVEQRLILKAGLQEAKEKLEPFMYLLPILNIFKKKEPNHSVLNAATSVGIDLFVGQKLAKAGWVTRLLVPMVLKGISSLVMKTKRVKVPAIQE
ncbi:MAG TPA: hypothetical protein PL167_01555 [Cyclobacteriaceae bacterium]|nr:hypothetical protein [Cyclobacteriaceae bacterium]